MVLVGKLIQNNVYQVLPSDPNLGVLSDLFSDLHLGKQTVTWKKLVIGGWTNPFEKYARQTGSFPQIGVKKLFKKNKIFETTT